VSSLPIHQPRRLPDVRTAGRDRFLTSGYYSGGGRFETRPGGNLLVQAEFRLQFEVRLVSGVFDPQCPDLAEVYRPLGRCVAVVEENLDRLYGAAIKGYFAGHGIELFCLSCPISEADKSLHTVGRIADFLGPRGHAVTSDEPVLVVGSGAWSDTAGMACALLHRRTPYIMVATSLVAAIDAGPSPRTCVNAGGIKNLLGVIHPPVLTLVDRSLFATLPDKDVRHGLAEALKMAIIDAEPLFAMFEHSTDLVTSRLASPAGTPQAAHEEIIIRRTLESFLRHEGPNLWEIYQDRPHAFGHTWSPGFEPAARLLHGHAVSIDMAFSSTLASLLGWIPTDTRDRILDACQQLGLAIYHPILGRPGLLADAQQATRAKRGGHALWAPLPRPGIGRCDYASDISADLLDQALKEHTRLCAARPVAGGIDPYLN
jgi:3-dehydroquinate synthetase